MENKQVITYKIENAGIKKIVEEVHKITYPTCINCGTDKKDEDYHWCFSCFTKWTNKQLPKETHKEYLFTD